MGNIFRNRRDLGALPTLSTLLAPSSSRYVPNVVTGWQIRQGVAGTLVGTGGMTTDVSTYADDANFQISMPFNFPFFGVNKTVYVGSNSYVTFGAGSSAYTALSCTIPGKALMIQAADNSWNKLYHKDNGNGSVTIRYEGRNTAGSGATNMTWEVTLYNDGKIMLVTGAVARTGGVCNINNGANDAYCLVYTFAENQSFVFEPTGSGASASYNIYTGASVA